MHMQASQWNDKNTIVTNFLCGLKGNAIDFDCRLTGKNSWYGHLNYKSSWKWQIVIFIILVFMGGLLID